MEMEMRPYWSFSTPLLPPCGHHVFYFRTNNQRPSRFGAFMDYSSNGFDTLERDNEFELVFRSIANCRSRWQRNAGVLLQLN
jgi:hypothetical protein